MKIYNLTRTQVLNQDLETIWEYFSSPENLNEITPKNMGFRILTKRPLPKMYEGQEIEYKVSPVLNIPLYWKTRITKVDDRIRFIDEQLKGPYSLWRHVHTFEQKEGKVIMEDSVDYALPMGFLGRIAHKLYVKNRLKEIFDYRYKVVERVFN